MMHAQDRTVGQQLTSVDGKIKKDLDQMPVDLAHEVVGLWREFIQELQHHNNPLAAALAQTKLDEAIVESELVVTNEVNRVHGISPIAW
jgi:hypothetical protein